MRKAGFGEGRDYAGLSGRERARDIEREEERENKRMREEADEQRRALLYWDCTSTGVCGLAGLYTSKQNKERLYRAIKEESEKNKAREKSLRLNYKRSEDTLLMFFSPKEDINWDFGHCGEFARLFCFRQQQKFVWDDAFFPLYLNFNAPNFTPVQNFPNGLHMVSKGF